MPYRNSRTGSGTNHSEVLPVEAQPHLVTVVALAMHVQTQHVRTVQKQPELKAPATSASAYLTIMSPCQLLTWHIRWPLDSFFEQHRGPDMDPWRHRDSGTLAPLYHLWGCPSIRRSLLTPSCRDTACGL